MAFFNVCTCSYVGAFYFMCAHTSKHFLFLVQFLPEIVGAEFEVFLFSLVQASKERIKDVEIALAF